MKKLHILTTAVMLAVMVGSVPAAALSVGTSSNTNVSLETGVQSNTNTSVNGGIYGKNDSSVRATSDSRLDASKLHWKQWTYNNGVMGTVTAVKGDMITIKSTTGTTYTVDISDAVVRSASNPAIAVNDNIYVQGVVDDNAIVATLVINGKTKPAAPSEDDKRNAIVGTVTAKSGTTLTVLGKTGTTYTVAAANASVWEKGNDNSSVSNIDVGDSVVVQGTVNGSAVTATRIHTVSFPSTSANGGLRGTVTAVNGDTFTLMVAGGTTYTVNMDDAEFKDRKGEDQDADDIDVGEMVVVTGDVSGSTVDAEVISEAKINKGFFYRVGNFFKSVFGKKGVNGTVKMEAN
jgi:hypothetical protein